MEYSSNLFSQRLKNLRKEKNLYQKELAAAIGVKPGTIAAWEAGHRVPELGLATKLADYFNVSVDYLLGRTNDVFPSPSFKEKSLHKRRIELEEAFKELLRSETVMFDGLPVGELDEEIIEDLEIMLKTILDFLRKKRAENELPAETKTALEKVEKKFPQD